MQFSLRGELGLAEFSTSRRLFVLRMAKRAVRSVSFVIEGEVKKLMPKDTGRAAASWGRWTPGDLRAANPDAGAGDAVWEEKGDFEITQGSNVDYVGDLNDGTSQQAPAGFIDRAAEKAQRELNKEIDDLMRAF